MQRQMHLGVAYHAFGCHRAAWRHPQVPRGDMTDLDLHLAIARKTEEGLFDFLFAADSLTALWNGEHPDHLGRQPPIRALDPLMLMALVAGKTEKLGLISTVNTTYSAPPYTVARMVATLDHLTAGRAGWNLVTGGSPAEAPNFSNQPHPPAELRYEMATEFAEVVFGLWDSWDEDAFVCDRESGFYYDRDKMRVLNHHGRFYHSMGPLTTPRTPQGRPITVQAGASDAGRELAAKIADVVFSVATTVEAAKAYYDDIKTRAAKYGRSPDQICILPGVQVHVGRTEDEAQEKLGLMEDSYDMAVAIHQLNQLFDVDLNDYPLDEPFPDAPEAEKWGSRPATMKEIARANNYTLRQVAVRFASFGHWILAGTPTSIVDRLEEFFHGGGADGFIIQPPYMTGSLDDFVELVVPELQRRGLYRTRYEGSTLRDHLGLQVHRADA